MRKNVTKILSVICVLCLLTATAAGCKKEASAPSLMLSETKISAFVGEAYDLKTLITDWNEAVTYTASGEYFDTKTTAYIPVTFDGLSFTLTEEASFTAEITAAINGKETKKQVEVAVNYRSDEVDVKIIGTYMNEVIQKSLNHDKQYLHSKNSNSSVKVKYIGVNNYNHGAFFNCIDGTLLDKYWSISKESDLEKAWENAVISFWVYNPNDDALEFSPRIQHRDSGLDLDWTEASVRTAAPKQWTHIYYSYRALGITTNFYFDEEGYWAPGGNEGTYDTNYMKIQLATRPTDQTTMYTFDAYIDDYDIIAYNDETKDLFPGLDTAKPIESEKHDLTNLQYNEPGGDWNKDTTTHSTDSQYSQKIAIKETDPDKLAIFNIYSIDWKQLNLTSATITFDIKFGGSADGNVTLYFDRADTEQSKRYTFSVTNPQNLPDGITAEAVTGADGWYRVTIDCAKTAELFNDTDCTFESVRKFIVNFTRPGTDSGAGWANFDNLFLTGATENAA